MTPTEQLFIQKYNELVYYTYANTEYNVIRSSAILRQLYFEGQPLTIRINRNYHLSFIYKIDVALMRVYSNDIQLCFTLPDDVKNIVVAKNRYKILNDNQFKSYTILKSNDKTFSIKDVVKFVANNIGGIHLDSDETIRKEPISCIDRQFIYITLNAISRIVIEALRPLKDSIIPLNNVLPFLFYNTTNDIQNYYFPGIRQFLECREMSECINNGFGVLMNIKIHSQPKVGNRIIFEIGGIHRKFNFKFYIENNENLVASIRYANGKTVKLNYRLYNIYYFDRWNTISFFFEIHNDELFFELFIKDQIVTSKNIHCRSKALKYIDSYTIGSNLNGKQNAAFSLSQLAILKDKISTHDKKHLVNYFNYNRILEC